MIGAGALILLEIMERIGAGEVVVSEHDILDGIAYAVAEEIDGEQQQRRL